MPSLKPSEMTSGGAPTNRNMLIARARFGEFQYEMKDGSLKTKEDGTPATTIAALLDLIDDDGKEYQQRYSVGDPKRYEILEDGKVLGPPEATITTSCNFSILMNAAVNAGFPENKLGDDISILEGLYAYWIGVPEPERSGLNRGGANQPKREIPVPSEIKKLPWEKAKAGVVLPKASKTAASGAKAGGAKKTAALSQEVLDAAVEFIGGIVSAEGTTTRQELAARVFSDLGSDPNRDAVAAAIYSPALQAALLANGYTVDGEEISVAE